MKKRSTLPKNFQSKEVLGKQLTDAGRKKAGDTGKMRGWAFKPPHKRKGGRGVRSSRGDVVRHCVLVGHGRGWKREKYPLTWPEQESVYSKEK